MELFNLKTCERAIKINFDNLNWLQEIEIGFDFDFSIEYFHTWQKHQTHCLSLGNIYIAWQGAPYLDVKE